MTASTMTATFMQEVKEGRATLDDIDDWVEAWHQSGGESELHDTIGMTQEEYSAWVQNPKTIERAAERHGLDMTQREIQEHNLKITHGKSADEQEASFMNATLTQIGGKSISIALTPPSSLLALGEAAMNDHLRAAFADLIQSGWSVEIQCGIDDKLNEERVDAFAKLIQS